MNNAQENPVKSAAVAIYSRIKTYRPHLSEEDRRLLVQKEVLSTFGVFLTNGELNEVLPKPTPVKAAFNKPVLIKRDTTEIPPGGHKRAYRRISDIFCTDIKYSGASSAVKRSSFKFKDIAQVQDNQDYISPVTKDTNLRRYTFADISRIKDEHFSKTEDDTNADKLPNAISKIPRPLFKFGRPSVCEAAKKHNMESKEASITTQNTTSTSTLSTGSKNVYERLYNDRPRPCSSKVELVKHIREVHTIKSLTNKQPPKTVNCTTHEPPSKRKRYNKDCLNKTSSVFDRLYAERKQLNSKKLTDVQKRELYLKKQREEMKKAKQNRDKQNAPQRKLCECGCNFFPESSTSDFDMNEFTLSDSDEVSDIFESTLVDRNDSALDVSKFDFNSNGELFNSTTKTEDGEEPNTDVSIQKLLDSLATRFNEQMSLCPVSENELID